MKRLYVIVRADLAPGLQLAQSCHAVAAFGASYPEPFAAWHRGESNIVCLQARDEGHLRELLASLDIGAQVATFCEPDLGGELTAFACDRVPRAFSSLPLALRPRRSRSEDNQVDALGLPYCPGTHCRTHCTVDVYSRADLCHNGRATVE